MNTVRIQTIGSLIFLTAAIFLLTVSTAPAAVFTVAGFNGTGVTTSVDATYTASCATEATITLMVMNTTPSPPTNGAITGLAFNVPTNVTGLASFSFSSTDPDAKNFTAFLLPNNVDAGPFEGFDLGVTNGKVNFDGAVSASASSKKSSSKMSGAMKAMLKAQSKYDKAKAKADAAQAAVNAAVGDEKSMAKALKKLEKALAKMDIAELAMAQAEAQASGMGMGDEKENINGGKPSEGIDPGFKGTFEFGITGTDLDMLNINSFLALLSEGKDNEAGSEGFIVRFQGVGLNGEGSDFAPPDGEFPPQNIPEPATLLLLGAGLAQLAGFGRKRIAKT